MYRIEAEQVSISLGWAKLIPTTSMPVRPDSAIARRYVATDPAEAVNASADCHDFSQLNPSLFRWFNLAVTSPFLVPCDALWAPPEFQSSLPR
jgi:hypothetical protein